MTDPGRRPRFLAAAGDRLADRRWTLAVAITGIAATAVLGGPLPAVAAGLAAVAAAVLSPRREPGRSEGGGARGPERSDFAGLPAESLAAAVPDPLIVFDREGVIVHANEAARATFGTLGEGTLLQLRFRAPEIRDLVERLLAGRPAVEAVEYAERVPIERWFRVGGMPAGAGGLFVLAFRDQSELRRIDRMRSDFIANASHELRTPLASIAGFIDTLRGPARNDTEARERFLQIMQNQTARMARLIDDLLSLSRLEMKPLAAAAGTLDLGPVVEGVVDALRHLAQESGVAIEKHLPAAPVPVRGDRDELTQVFENLLENACKYGRSGGRVIVTIAPAKPRGEGPTVEVKDFGPGIAEEHIPRVTERFYRVDVETSRGQKGTGLGLAIVKHILTRHKARLSIRSKPGEGASFTVHFPPA